MEPIIFTPRLKLTLLRKAERGSSELEWLHELHSDEKVTWWSIFGQAKSLEDTERLMGGFMPTNEGGEKPYRVAYAVHEMIGPSRGSAEAEPHIAEQREDHTKFVGLVTVKSMDANSLPLPEDLTLPAAAAATTLTLYLSYSFLPSAWGKGFATESLKAVFGVCRRGRAFWAPFSSLYVQAIVNRENPASRRVMEKSGMEEKGVYVWTGKAVFLAGKWQERSDLHIFGMHLLLGKA